MKPKDQIREALKDFVEPRLLRLGFTFSKSSLGFVRRDGDFRQEINTHLDRWNREDVSAQFYFSFAVRSTKYRKWHLAEYKSKPANDFLASVMYSNLRGWKHPRPNVTHQERAEYEMLLLLEDTLDLGLPFLEKYSNWENAAARLIEERWFHAKACDFCIIAGNLEKAHWCLERALEDWKRQPNRSFYLGEKEDIRLRYEKFFNEKHPVA